jgi:predicted DNA-binding ArsR family transcriptional regulator
VLEKIADDRYPSGELMDRLEAAFTSREQVENYLDVLLEKIEDDHYPSKQMLDRVHRLSLQLEAVDVRASLREAA